MAQNGGSGRKRLDLREEAWGQTARILWWLNKDVVIRVKEEYVGSSLGERMESHTTNRLTDSRERSRCGNRKGRGLGSLVWDTLICKQKSHHVARASAKCFHTHHLLFHHYKHISGVKWVLSELSWTENQTYRTILWRASMSKTDLKSLLFFKARKRLAHTQHPKQYFSWAIIITEHLLCAQSQLSCISTVVKIKCYFCEWTELYSSCFLLQNVMNSTLEFKMTRKGSFHTCIYHVRTLERHM